MFASGGGWVSKKQRKVASICGWEKHWIDWCGVSGINLTQHNRFFDLIIWSKVPSFVHTFHSTFKHQRKMTGLVTQRMWGNGFGHQDFCVPIHYVFVKKLPLLSRKCICPDHPLLFLMILSFFDNKNTAYFQFHAYVHSMDFFEIYVLFLFHFLSVCVMDWGNW